MSEAGGGRWGRGGRRRCWQPAGTHAAPRPTWPAALPSLAAAAARCPLTSGGECGNAGAGRARARCGPSRLKRKSSLPPYACLRRPSGTPGRPPAAHKASRRLGGPLAAGNGATHLSGRSAPSLPGSPFPGCPDTSQSRIPFPPYWENFLLPLDGSNRAKKPSPSSPLQSLPEPHPSDRCVQGTLDEPPGVPRGLQPPPTRQLLEGFRFPEAEPLPAASSWRPVPLLVLLLCSGSGGFLGGEEETRPGTCGQDFAERARPGLALAFCSHHSEPFVGSGRRLVHTVLG